MDAQISPIKLLIPDNFFLDEDISPYEVPRLIVATYFPEIDMFELEFRYISSEVIKNHSGPHGSLDYGKNSYRLFSLKLTNASRERCYFEHFLLNGLTNLATTLNPSKFTEGNSNYITIKTLISQNSNVLHQYLDESLRAANLAYA